MQGDLNFPYQDGPQGGTLRQVAEGVHWLRMPLPFSLTHINLWLVEDGEGFAIIDTGINDAKTQGFWEQIFNDHLGGRPITRIFATHCHPDHIGASGWLCERWGVELWMTQAEWQQANIGELRAGGASRPAMARHFERLGFPVSRLRKMGRMQGYFQNMVGPLPPSYRRVRGGDRIEIGGRTWVVCIGRGHSPEHACYHCPELNLMVGGDQVLPYITPTIGVSADEPHGDPLGLYLESIEQFYALPADCLILPAHELPYRQIQFRLTQLKLHHQERCQLMLDACRTPQTAMVATQAMFAHRELSGFDVMLALGETLAHLHYLLYRGQIRRSIDDEGIYRYQAC